MPRDFLYDVARRCALTIEAAQKGLADKVSAGTFVVTDKHHPYSKVMGELDYVE